LKKPSCKQLRSKDVFVEDKQRIFTIPCFQAVDFDPDSLRKQLPKAVSALEWAISQGKGRVYIHCTAGLGRAPAVAISYMFWFENMDVSSLNLIICI
jgi:protein-tyrosine phosphatase